MTKSFSKKTELEVVGQYRLSHFSPSQDLARTWRALLRSTVLDRSQVKWQNAGFTLQPLGPGPVIQCAVGRLPASLQSQVVCMHHTCVHVWVCQSGARVFFLPFFLFLFLLSRQEFAASPMHKVQRWGRENFAAHNRQCTSLRRTKLSCTFLSFFGPMCLLLDLPQILCSIMERSLDTGS